MSAALSCTSAQPSALDTAAFARLSKAEAESFVAARYCAQSEAGYSLAEALAIATRTEIDVPVGYGVAKVSVPLLVL